MVAKDPVTVSFQATTSRTKRTISGVDPMNMIANWKKTMNKLKVEVETMSIPGTDSTKVGPVNERSMWPVIPR